MRKVERRAVRAAPRDPRRMRQRSRAKPRRIRAVLFSSSTPGVSLKLLHCYPCIEKQRVVSLRADGGAVELVVPDVLQPDARVEPRPSRRKILDERDVGDLADPAVAVRAEAAGKSGVQDRIWAAPGVEILASQH